MIKLDFELIESKYTIIAKLQPVGAKKAERVELIFDPGSSMTVMPSKLFVKMGYVLDNPKNVLLRGINGESKGISTIINNLVIGNEDFGRARVVIGDLLEEFENSIILGVNILVWYNYAVLHHTKQIVLDERKIKTAIPRQDRFIALYPQIMNMLASTEDTDTDTNREGVYFG